MALLVCGSFFPYSEIQGNPRKIVNVTASALKNINNCLNTKIYSYLETFGGKGYNLYLNGVHFFNTGVN